MEGQRKINIFGSKRRRNYCEVFQLLNTCSFLLDYLVGSSRSYIHFWRSKQANKPKKSPDGIFPWKKKKKTWENLPSKGYSFTQELQGTLLWESFINLTSRQVGACSWTLTLSSTSLLPFNIFHWQALLCRKLYFNCFSVNLNYLFPNHALIVE